MVVGGERFCDVVGVVGAQLLFWANSINNPLNLYTKYLSGGTEQQIAENLNDDLLAGFALPGVEHLLLPQTGIEVEGWLLTPATGSAPYPGFLYIHGGPHSAFGYGFHYDFQMLTGAGYADADPSITGPPPATAMASPQPSRAIGATWTTPTSWLALTMR